MFGLFRHEMASSLETWDQTHLGFDEIKVRNSPSLMRV